MYLRNAQLIITILVRHIKIILQITSNFYTTTNKSINKNTACDIKIVIKQITIRTIYRVATQKGQKTSLSNYKLA